VLILSATDVMRVSDARSVTSAVHDAFCETSTGSSQVPPRMKLSLADTDNRLVVMSASMKSALATKVVTLFPGNSARGIPLILGVAVLNDTETGIPIALLDGASLTGLRTAAGSAVATQALAPPVTSILAIIGAGAQAKAHLKLLANLYKFDEVRICARGIDSAQRLATESATWVEGRVVVVANPEEAVRGADIVVTATTAVEPVVQGEWLSANAHVCAVGATRPGIREIDSEVLIRASVIAVDTRRGALFEAGDLMTPISEGILRPESLAEVGEILLGRRQGRAETDAVTVYKSVGTAAMDAAVAAALYRAAREQGVGTEVSLNEWE
jgi:ornithine cyclodeaminase/alanine dehydrogenase-like protein (mu-crystallin family)